MFISQVLLYIGTYDIAGKREQFAIFDGGSKKSGGGR